MFTILRLNKILFANHNETAKSPSAKTRSNVQRTEKKALKPYKDVTSGTVYAPSRLVTQRIKTNLISTPPSRANSVQRTRRGESPDERGETPSGR